MVMLALTGSLMDQPDPTGSGTGSSFLLKLTCPSSVMPSL